MFAIGDFARHGRVSVRMLRHYDAIGLLRPAHVDEATGYRSYEAAQLAELNRLVALKDLPASRLVALSSTAASFTPEDIGPVVNPLCAELGRRLPEATAVKPSGRLTCWYSASGDQVVIHAGVPAAVEAEGRLNGLLVVDLPATRAATIVHRGRIDAVLPAWQALARWIDDNGHRSGGPARELYLDCPDEPSLWVTELQEPIRP